MRELRFASTEEALQHLANVTGKHVKIADKTGASEMGTEMSELKSTFQELWESWNKRHKKSKKFIGNLGAFYHRTIKALNDWKTKEMRNVNEPETNKEGMEDCEDLDLDLVKINL